MLVTSRCRLLPSRTVNDDDIFDRDAILARRALLLSSALALFHCSPAPNPTVSSSVDSVDVPAAIASEAPLPPSSASPSVSAKNPTGPTLPGGKTWDEAIASAPPFAAGARLPAEERAQFEQMNQGLKARYEEVRAVWEAAKGLCDAAMPECRPAWRALGEKLKTAHDTLRGPRRLCGGGDNPPSIGQSRDEHLSFLRGRLEEAEKHLAQVAAGLSVQSEQEWLKHVANANVSPPMPCLSCMAPSGWPISTVVLFDAGSSTLNAAAETSLARVREELKQQLAAPNSPVERFEIRGHADPQEKDGDKLSLARAQAVHAWLAKNGLKDPKLVTVAIGPGLAIAAIASRNQRVEFVIKGKGIRP